ncbi:MAG: insulinase family protein [Candidatus Cloacimonetes bacterium]|nr:insulinase family protein [Candidatus Cloacimonadota bacterium]
MKLKDKILANKFKAIYAKDNSHPIVNMQLYVKMGSGWESDEQEGFTHLLEHLVFKSTKKYPNSSIMSKASSLGAYINAYTDYDTTCFYISLPRYKTAKGIELLSQLAISANFSDEDFESEKKVVIEELKQYQKDKEEYFIEQIPRLYFKESPYNKPIIGSITALKKCKADEIRQFYKQYYVPENCFLCVTGDIEFYRIHKTVEKYFSEWTCNNENKTKLQYHIAQYSKTNNVQYDNNLRHLIYEHFPQKMKSKYLAFVFPEYSDKQEESLQQTLLTRILFLGNNSILHKRLFLKDKLIYDMKVHSYSGVNSGICILLISLRKQNYAYRVIETIFEEITKFMTGKSGKEELDNSRTVLEYSYYYSFEYIESLNNCLSYEEIIGDYKEIFNWLYKIRKISIHNLRDLAKELFSPDKLMVVSAGKTSLRKEKIEELFKLNLNDNYNSTAERNPAIIGEIDKGKSKNYANLKISHTMLKKNRHMEHILPNGIKLFINNSSQKDLCGISLALKSSQLYENQSQLGLNQLTSSMLLYGNKSMEYVDFLSYCSNNGISFSVSCSKENTKIRAKCFSDKLVESLSCISDTLYKPTFPLEHFYNVKNTYISNIERATDFPETMALYSWKQLLFGMNSNLLGKDGQIETLSKFEQEDCVKWHQDHLINSKASLVITGDLDFDKTIKACENIFTLGKHPQENDLSIIADINPSEQRKKLIRNGSDQSIIFVGGFSCPYAETEERMALLVLSQILGGDLNSRLLKELREKRGIAYSIGFNFDSLMHTGYFNAYTIVDKSFEDKALEVIHKIFSTIRERGVNLKEINTSKQYIKGLSYFEEEGVLSQAQTLSSLFLENKDYDYYQKRDQRIKMVTKDQIQLIADKYFRPEQLYTLTYS